MRTLLVGVVLATVGATGIAQADTWSPAPRGQVAQQFANSALFNDGVSAGGRCHGMSYGTGARSCGTATGGPVGGLTSRN
jgi:hypothetical protein